MPTTKRTGLPEFWTTGLAKLLIGDQSCQFQAWIKGHYRIDKVKRDESNLTQWKMRHTEQLTAATARFRSEGWKCTVERYFRVTGTSAILTGKTDLITQKDGKRPVIRDVKGGDPQDSDLLQVQIYQVAIPLAWSAPEMQFDGEVIYATHTVPSTSAAAQAIKPKLFGLLRQLGTDVRPPASPSEQTCRFCDVSKSDCPDRIEIGEGAVEVLTSEF